MFDWDIFSFASRRAMARRVATLLVNWNSKDKLRQVLLPKLVFRASKLRMSQDCGTYKGSWVKKKNK